MEKQAFSLKQNVFTPAAPVKVMINVGCLFDILTGTFVQGVRGEQILNGGMSYILGVVGGGNSFKSTITHYFNLTFLARIIGSTSGTYDTEINVREDHLQKFASHHPDMNGRDPIAEGTWVITDRTIYPGGDEWYDIAKDYMEQKRKNAKSIMVKTPFFNRERTGHLEIIQPTSNQVDSLSEFATNDVIKMQDDNVLGDKGGNTIFMRQGLQKNRFLQEIVGITAGSQSYMMLVAQMGDDFNMDPHNPKAKKLSYLPENLKIKGVPEKYTYITNQCYFSYHTAPMRDQATKAPLYPRSADDDLTGDTDLSLVSLRTLRSKSGPSGMAHQLVVSQSEGVLPSLTEFHFIKEHERYGLEGNLQNYTLVLCPDIKLSRTAVRRKIDAHPELRRATNILAEMCQMHNLWHHISKDILVEPKKLYDDIKALGYDWDFILKNTRGWWALEGTWEELKFLSTMDLLKMRAGLYIPYWMENPPEKAVELYNKMMVEPWSYNKGNGQPNNRVKPEYLASS